MSCKAGPACCSSTPGVHGYEMAVLANDLSDSGRPVVAGISTHPHWDHLLWHARLGAAPRYGTARCAATVRVQLSDARWRARITEWIPPNIAEQGRSGYPGPPGLTAAARRARTTARAVSGIPMAAGSTQNANGGSRSQSGRCGPLST